MKCNGVNDGITCPWRSACKLYGVVKPGESIMSAPGHKEETKLGSRWVCSAFKFKKL